MRKYLKDYVAEYGTLPLKIESIGSPEENRNGKTVRLTTFVLKSTGQALTESLLETTFKYDLKGAKVGDNLEAFIKDNGYVGYRIISSNGDSVIPPSQNNTQQVKVERQVTKEKREEDEYWAKKDIGASLGMLLKIAMSVDGEFDRALAQAILWRPKFQKAVEQAYAQDKFGAKEDSPTTSPKVELPDEAKKFFGEDLPGGPFTQS